MQKLAVSGATDDCGKAKTVLAITPLKFEGLGSLSMAYFSLV